MKKKLNLFELEEELLLTIGKVSEMLNIPQSVLRFWETQFSQISPKKIKGRRYYDKKDLEIVENIKSLLYDQGLTIKGVHKILEKNLNDNGNSNNYTTTFKISEKDFLMLSEILAELKIIRKKLIK